LFFLQFNDSNSKPVKISLSIKKTFTGPTINYFFAVRPINAFVYLEKEYSKKLHLSRVKQGSNMNQLFLQKGCFDGK